jgi:hypothetical protein
MFNQPGADLLPLLYYLFISSLVCLLIYSLVDLFIGSLVLSFINLSWLGVGMGLGYVVDGVDQDGCCRPFRW